MAYITINYAEAGSKEPLNYKSVEIHYGDELKRIFNTGDFVKDWYDMRKFMIIELSETETHFSHSSSVDHFIMDGAPYESAYLHMSEDKAELKYVDHNDPDYIYTQQDIFENGIEFFVPEGTQPTWEELKTLYK